MGVDSLKVEVKHACVVALFVFFFSLGIEKTRVKQKSKRRTLVGTQKRNVVVVAAVYRPRRVASRRTGRTDDGARAPRRCRREYEKYSGNR